MSDTLNSNCPICDSTKIGDLRGFEVSQLFKCDNCTHVFQKRIPSDEELKKHYVYEAIAYQSPITAKRYNELLDTLEPYRVKNNILDIGCGNGFFLEIAKKRGWNVYGTELNPKAIKTCSEKGIKVYADTWLDEQESSEFFDVVTAFELFEHLAKPNPLAAQITKALRSGGVVYTTTPNFNAINRYLIRNKWHDVISYPEHLAYFTPKTMHYLWNSHGLKKVYTKTTGFSLTHLRRGLKVSEQQIVNANSDDERIRVASDTNVLFKFIVRIVNSVLVFFRIGESLKSLYLKR